MATESFGRWLKRRRSGLGLTQAELAQRIGYAWDTVQKVETDKLRPSKALAAKLAEALELPPDQHPAFIRFARDEGDLPDLPTHIATVPPPPTSASTSPPPSGTVTFLFTDIEGSSALWERYPHAMPQSLARHHALLRYAIQTAGGAVFKLVGDAFCAAFPTPQSALLAAAAAQRALQAPETEWGETGPLRVRMGLHLGPAHWDGADYATNDTLNRVARVLAAGHGGQILLTGAVVEVVSRQPVAEVTWRDLGGHRLRGLSQAERLYQVVASGLADEFPPLQTVGVTRHNLPIPPTPLIGRHREQAALLDRLGRAEGRLVTLTGPGGTGKTRLALEVARTVVEGQVSSVERDGTSLTSFDASPPTLHGHFPEGVYFVNLAPISDPALLASTIAQTLEVREQGGRPLLDSLTDYLRDKRLLLVLDNFEQVVEAAPVVADLLAHAPALKVLVTSRVPLHLRGEKEFEVPPLPLPAYRHLPPLDQLTQYAAVALFIQRAQGVKPDFQVTNANAPAVAEICHRLDGLPLAIELAAARIKALTPQALLQRLERRLPTLTGGARDLPTRQQTLRNTIAWSYDLLDDAEKRLFRRLAIFVGGCTLEAAEAVGGAEGDLPMDVLDGLISLVDKSLLRQEAQPDGQPRYAMLETIREFALEQLEASGEAPRTRQAHADYYLALAEEAAPKLRSGECNAWLARFESDHDNLRAVLAWYQTQPHLDQLALRLVAALDMFWYFRGYLSEGREWIEAALARTDASQRTQARGRALFAAGHLALHHGAISVLQPRLEESVAILREVGDKAGLTAALTWLSYATRDDLRTRERAYSLAQESVALARELGDEWALSSALHHLSVVVSMRGDKERSLSLSQESARLAREVGDGLLLSEHLWWQAVLARGRGEYSLAHSLFEQALSLVQMAGVRWAYAVTLYQLGYLALWEGDYKRAIDCCEESVAVYRELGSQWHVALVLHTFGRAARYHGELERAKDLLEESLTLFRQANGGLDIPFVLSSLGHLARDLGEYAQAQSYFEESLAIHQAAEDQFGIFESLHDLGLTECDIGNYQQAHTYFTETLPIVRALEDVRGIAWGLVGLAKVATGQTQAVRAARLLGAADGLFTSAGGILMAARRDEFDRDVAATRAGLDAATFEAAWAKGRAMTLEEAVEYALAEGEART